MNLILETSREDGEMLSVTNSHKVDAPKSIVIINQQSNRQRYRLSITVTDNNF